MTVWKFAPYVLKSLWRHRTRTALTVSGSAVALFVFCFIGAVREGLAALTRGRAADRTLVVFQANRFCPSTSRLPEDYARALAELPGVTDVVPIKVFMNNCRASLDLDELLASFDRVAPALAAALVGEDMAVDCEGYRRLAKEKAQELRQRIREMPDRLEFGSDFEEWDEDLEDDDGESDP